MTKATVIFGEEAVNFYKTTGQLPSQEWLMDNGGIVTDVEFRTRAEYNAYLQGLSDRSGWSDYHVIPHVDTPQEPETHLWLRVGVTVKGSKVDIEKVLQGDEDTLCRLLETRSFDINGETYISGTVVEEYNNENNTDFEEEDINFYSITISMNE